MCTLGGAATAAQSLAPVLASISPQQPLFSAYYDQASHAFASNSLPSNVALCQPPDLEVGYGDAVQGAREMFARLFPGQEFLPAAAENAEQEED